MSTKYKQRSFSQNTGCTDLKYVDSQSYWKRPEELQKKAPKDIQEIFQVLLAEIKIGGPIRNRWPNYGKLQKKKIVITATCKKEGRYQILESNNLK